MDKYEILKAMVVARESSKIMNNDEIYVFTSKSTGQILITWNPEEALMWNQMGYTHIMNAQNGNCTVMDYNL